MSPVMDNFVHSLVEMARAMEELPLVQAECERLRQATTEQSIMIASREQSILRLKSEIEGLQANVRDAEVSRDDAELRFLELDEKAGKVLHLLASITPTVVSAADLLSPPKPEPVLEPVQAQPQPAQDVHHDYDPLVQGQREPDPTSVGVQTTAPVDTPQPTAFPTEPVASTGEGQSEPNPTGQSGQPIAASEGQPSTGTIQEQPLGETVVAATSQPDEIGYHNEPANQYATEWYQWADKMDALYGFGRWPARPLRTAAQ